MPQSFFAVFLLLAGCYVLNPISMDATLPAIAAMAEAMAATPADIQFSLAALTSGIAAGQIIFGAVTDRVGRRIVLVPGAAVFTLCAVLIPLIPDLRALIGLRFVQGLAVAAALIVARAVVRDLYDRNQSAKLYAYLFMALGTVPSPSGLSGSFTRRSQLCGSIPSTNRLGS